MDDLLDHIDYVKATLMKRYGVTEDVALEAAHQGFANVWEKKGTFDPVAFRKYFYVAAKNELIKRFDHEKKFRYEYDINVEEEIEAENQRGMEEITKQLDEIQAQLPKGYCELFALLREGIDHREIAKRLHKSHGAIRVMKTRMIQYCKAALVAMLMFVLLPVGGTAQPLESMEIVKKSGSAYYIMVGEDTVASRRDFHKVPGDLEYYAQRAGGQKVWYQYTEIGELEYSYVDSARITVVDTTNAESIALRNVRWQHQQDPDSLNYRIVLTADSWADSVKVGWFAADSLTHIDKRSTLYPQGALYDTLESDFKGKIQVTINAFWEGWVIRDSLLIDMGFISSLGTKKKEDIMPLIAGYDTRLTAKAGVADDGAGNVTGWTDQVGGTRQLTVPSGQSSPTLGALLNGFQVLYFDGVDGGSVLQLADATLDRRAGNNNFTYTYALLRAPLTGSFNYFIDVESTINRNAVYLSPGAVVGRNAGDPLFGSATGNEWLVITVKFDRNGVNSEIFIDGTLVATGSLGSSSGTGLTVGSRGDFFGEGEFEVAEIVEYYDIAEHSQSEIDQNVSFLQSEWGLGGGTTKPFNTDRFPNHQ